MKVIFIAAVIFAVAFAAKVPEVAPKDPVVPSNSSVVNATAGSNSSVPSASRAGRLLLLSSGRKYVDLDREVIVPASDVVLTRTNYVYEKVVPVYKSEIVYV